MPDISLTDFVDFAITSGPSQLTKVKQIASRGAYDPRFDFWKPMREGIQDFHVGKGKLDDVVKGLSDPKKMKRYPLVIGAYKKFLRKQGKVMWFKPPMGIWAYGGLNVKINPELGLVLGERKWAVKLYFKDEKPSKQRLKVVFELMRVALNLDENISAAVMDVANGRLVTPKPLDLDLSPLLQAQAIAFVHLWKAVTGTAASVP